MKLRKPPLPAGGSVAGLLALLAAPVMAFDVPRHVFEFARLSEAQSEAFSDKKPLLLLYADPKKEPT